MISPWEYSDYSNIRATLDEPYRHLSDRELEMRLAAAGLDADNVDEFFGAIGSLGRQLAGTVGQFVPAVRQFTSSPIFQGALSAAGQGASAGLVAGPQGAAIGAGLGLLSGLLGGALSGGGRSAPRPGAGAPPARTAVPVQPARGGLPAANLLSLLAQPQVMQALLAMSLGRAGARTVPVGQASVPVHEIATTIGSLAHEAAASYLDAVGDAIGSDPGESIDGDDDPVGRADRIVELFGTEAAADAFEPWHESEPWNESEPVEDLPTEVGSIPIQYEPIYA